MKMTRIFAGLCLTWTMMVCGADEQASSQLPPTLSMGKTEKFTIDGTITPEEIRNAAGVYGFCRLNYDKILKIFPADARFYVGTDGRNLYIAAQTEASENGVLQRMNKGKRGERVFADDNYEIVIAPAMKEGSPDYYRLLFNNKAAYFTTSRQKGLESVWEPTFIMNGTVKDKLWTMEILFPLDQFGISELKDGQTIGLRVCRNWAGLTKEAGGFVQSSWNQLLTEFSGTEKMPTVTYHPNAPVVHFDRLMKENTPSPQVTICNPAAEPVTVETLYQLMPSQSQSVNLKQTETIPAKGCSTISLKVPQLDPGETAETLYLVKDNKGNVLFRRFFKWGPDKINLYSTGVAMKDRVAFRYAFYPSSNRMFVRLDLAGSTKEDQTKNGVIAIVAKDSKRKVCEFTLPKPNAEKKVEQLLILPDLKGITKKENPSGIYELVLTAGEEKLTRTFERKVFDWEGNSLGKSHTVIPPFTPVKVKDNDVSTVLRKHTLNDAGLWKQVRAVEKDLFLDGGMVLTAVIDGKSYIAKGKGLHFTGKDDTFAEGYAEWSAGPLDGKTRFKFDMDGMMMCYLDLPASGVKVDSLTLTTALPDEEMTLLHACADGLRRNYGGKMPETWDSKQVPKLDVHNNYCVYVWMGNEERGFSVSMDNDKDWSVSKDVSSQTIRHKDGKTILTLNLFAVPVTLDRIRSIELAFQATPAKPMRENWRLYQAGVYGHQFRKYLKYQMRIYGSEFCQGAMANSLFPCNNDLTVWHKLAETRKTKVIPKDYIEQFAMSFKDHSWQEKFRRELTYGFNMAKGSDPDSVTFYTNLRGGRQDTPMARTFLDDWFREEFQPTRDREPRWTESRSYSVDPVESYRDYAMYCHKILFETGACDNLYWDDVYPSANYDRSGTLTRAYVMPDGELQPSTGYFNMREMVRRAAILQMEMGRTPNNMVHMTNVSATPLLSFAQQNLDWEDHVGTNMFQNRYTREYIRAVSIGRQMGNLPAGIGHVQGDAKSAAKARRSGTGVCLTHEVQWMHGGMYSGEYKRILLDFYEFGYGRPDVRVWNYWEKGYPVKITGGETSSIFLKKGKEMILVVCNYDKKDCTFTVSLDGVKNYTAVNGETKAALDVKDGKLTFTIPQYNFIYLKLGEL